MLDTVMSSFDCITATPSEDGTSFLMHSLIPNVVYTTWPINAILRGEPRQILPQFAIREKPFHWQVSPGDDTLNPIARLWFRQQ